MSEPTAAGRHRRALLAGFAISLTIFAVELAAGIASNSLALLADAWHVFADVSGMAISLTAVWLAARPTSGQRSFGLYRLEILAAAANALLLLAVSALVIWEAWKRLVNPPQVDESVMIAAAAFALIANLIVLRLLARGRRESLTVGGAYLEVLGDVLGALAVLIAGVVSITTGFLAADALASIVIGILIIPRTLRLLRDTLDVLLEATPKGVDLAEVRRHILETPGVSAVHDLHAWAITSGMNVVSAHVVLDADAEPTTLIDHLSDCLADDFDVDHSTFQFETPEHMLWEHRAARAQH